jgi:hypothetical protein
MRIFIMDGIVFLVFGYHFYKGSSADHYSHGLYIDGTFKNNALMPEHTIETIKEL